MKSSAQDETPATCPAAKTGEGFCSWGTRGGQGLTINPPRLPRKSRALPLPAHAALGIFFHSKEAIRREWQNSQTFSYQNVSTKIDCDRLLLNSRMVLWWSISFDYCVMQDERRLTLILPGTWGKIPAVRHSTATVGASRRWIWIWTTVLSLKACRLYLSWSR